MRVLLVNSHDVGGVEYYRMMHPNDYIAKNYPDWTFTTINSLNSESYDGIPNKEFIQSYDLVHFCRGIDVHGSTVNTDRLKSYGVPFGMDLDDYWELPSYHILYNDYLVHKKSEAIIQAIKDSNFVTCTTPILAKEIQEYNKNVHVLPNGIDHEETKWQPDLKRGEKMRFGFFQGSTHFHDIYDSCSDIVLAYKMLKDKFQVVLTGFLAEPDKPSVFIGYEKLLTDQLRVLDDELKYQEYLISLKRDGNEDYIDKRYWRCWQTNIQDWPYCYHFADVSIAPLKHNQFNKCKSELKMIEAGMKGKSIILSDVNPYKLLATDENCYKVKGMNTWYKQIKRCIDNPNEVWDKADQLREDVLAKHSLKVLHKERMQVYKHYSK